jgi:hypothetical protein
MRWLVGTLILAACGSCGESDESGGSKPAKDAGVEAGGGAGKDASSDAASDVTETPDTGSDASIDVNPDAPLPACPTFTEGASPGSVQLAAITETSGVVAAINTPDVLFVHNDSGDSARFFAISLAGVHLGTFTVTGASASDWEDMGSANGQIYLGDIGDNGESRANIKVYRVAEPSMPATPSTVALDGVETFTFTYPGGARNAETMFVDPVTDDLYIVQKTDSGTAGVYRKPAPLESGELEEVAQVDFGPLTTGGDISHDGASILVRTYSQAQLFRRNPGMSVADAMKGEPCSVPLHGEPQGESIGFAADDQAYFTISEFANQPIYRFVKD